MSDARPPLTEPARRLPTFREGVPITLGDGTPWHFPRPKIRYDPAVDGEGKFYLRRGRALLDPEIDDVLEQIVAAETDAEILNSTLRMAAFALSLNYDVAPDELPRLIFYVTDDDANMAMWRELIGLARGDFDRPKPTGDGSGTSSSPTESTRQA